MNELATMNAKDTVSAKLAECFVTIEGNRYLLFQAKNFEAKVSLEKKKVAVIGRTGTGNKTSSWSGTGSMTIYHNTEIFNDVIERYKNTGEDLYFDIQVTNEDPTSDAGRNTKIYKGCNLDGITLQSFDGDGDWLEQDVDFTFEDFESPEKFQILAGMQ